MSKLKKENTIKIKYGTVSLPLPLINKVKKRITGTGMPSVSSYVAFVLRQVLSSSEIDDKNKLLKKEEESELRRRLKILGY